ncbi:MAG: tetratricopeptide repeat protein [Euryarchaeota archaeon]|nr:tetratricopeptide repeat protein [Euryarchaeota archaeon]
MQIKKLDQSAESVYGKGYVLYEIGRYEDTLQRYDEAIDIWDKLERLLLADQRHDEAERVHDRMSEARFNKCFVLYKLSRYDDALNIIDQALESDPDRPNYLFSRGFVLLALEDPDSALESFEKAAAIAPKFADSWYYQGMIFYHRKQYDRALECYDKALENADTLHFPFPRYSFLNLFPTPRIKDNNAEILYCKGNTLFEMGRYEDALEVFEAALETRSQFVEAWQSIGNTRLKLGKQNAAHSAYECVLQLDPTNVDAWRSKGDLLSDMGQMEKAEDAYERSHRYSTEEEEEEEEA